MKTQVVPNAAGEMNGQKFSHAFATPRGKGERGHHRTYGNGNYNSRNMNLLIDEPTIHQDPRQRHEHSRYLEM